MTDDEALRLVGRALADLLPTRVEPLRAAECLPRVYDTREQAWRDANPEPEFDGISLDWPRWRLRLDIFRSVHFGDAMNDMLAEKRALLERQGQPIQ